MKTAAKIAALMLIAVLTACVPEAELTDRDWGDLRSKNDPGYGISNGVYGNQASYVPVITITSGTSPLPIPTRTNPNSWDMDIAFVKEADVLQAGNGNSILARLKSFLTFHTFTVGTGAFDADTIDDGVYDYDFVRRTAAINGGATVTIRFKELNTVPNGKSLVAKINPANYTFSGGCRLNLDDPDFSPTSTGTPTNGLYKAFQVTGGPAANTFVPPGDRRWTLAISNIVPPSNGEFSGSPSQQNNITIATLSGVTVLRGTATDAQAVQTIILNRVKEGIRLEKYEPATKRWGIIDSNPLPVYDVNVTASAAIIRVTYTPADLTAYRVRATGLRNFTTENAYGGVQQKIVVSATMNSANNATTTYKGYSRNEVTGQPGFWRNTANRSVQTSLAMPASGLRVQSDTNGKNVVLWLKTSSVGTPATYLKSSFNLAEFNRHFKIGYIQNTDGSTSALTTASMFNPEVKFIAIRAVEVTSSDNSGPNVNADELKITLDPNYTYQQNQPKSLLMSFGASTPFFTLNSSNNIIYGSFANWDKEIDGIPYFTVVPTTGTTPLNF